MTSPWFPNFVQKCTWQFPLLLSSIYTSDGLRETGNLFGSCLYKVCFSVLFLSPCSDFQYTGRDHSIVFLALGLAYSGMLLLYPIHNTDLLSNNPIIRFFFFLFLFFKKPNNFSTYFSPVATRITLNTLNMLPLFFWSYSEKVGVGAGFSLQPSRSPTHWKSKLIKQMESGVAPAWSERNPGLNVQLILWSMNVWYVRNM